MNETKSTLPAKIGGTEITRFNALRHGVLSRYAVLPWEDAAEYRDLVASLVAEHTPQGPTEEHLVEELAGILCRGQHLRPPKIAEAALRLPHAFDRAGHAHGAIAEQAHALDHLALVVEIHVFRCRERRLRDASPSQRS